MSLGPLQATRFRLLLALAALTLIVGATGLAVRQADRALRADLLRQARLVARAMSIQTIQALSGTAADLSSPDYQRLKEQLAAVRSARPECRFVYLMGRKADGAIFFFVDSEPSGTKDYSPPGQVYEEVPAGYRRVFDAKAEAVEGPVADRWGVWVSALVPMADPAGGAVVAVLGMDIAARVWKWDVAAKAAQPVGLLLVLLIGVAAALAAPRRVDASPKPILRRLLPPLAVMVLLLVIGAGALLYQQHRQELAGDIAADIADASGDLRAALDQQTSGLAAAVMPIVADARVRKALREGDADHLLADWRPVFETLRRERGLTHFYFLDANRVCLLRVHKPDKRGDRVSRFTAMEAERTGATASGIELGPLGTFTLRVVQPVFESGTLVGYVELGKEIEDALQTMHNRPGNQLAVVIRKEFLSRQIWEEGMRLLGREADWDRLSSNVVIYTTQGHLPEVFAAWADSAAGDRAHGATDREIAFNGKDWRVAATPLRDVSGAEVGALLVMRDITVENAALARLLALGGAAGAVLIALLLGFISVLLRRADAGIAAQQVKLREGEERYRTVADNTYDWEYWMAPDGSFTYVSPSCERITGYRIEEFLQDPGLLVRVAHPEDRDRLAAHIHDLGNGPGDAGYHELDFRILTRGGEERWIGHVCRRVYGCDGKYLGRRAGNRDITDRKRSEALTQRLAQLYEALSKCNEAIARCANEEELFQQVCRDAVLFGGMKMAWIGLVDGASQRVEAVASYGEGTEYLQGLQISVKADDPFGRGPTGTSIRENQPFWCQDFQHDPATALWHERGARFGWAASASLPLLRGGQPVGALTLYAGQVNAFDEDMRRLLSDMASNISFGLEKIALEAQRKKAAEKIRAAKDEWEKTFDAILDPIMILDTDFRIVRANTAMAAALGKTPGRIVGLTCYEQVHCTSEPAPDCPHKRLLADGESHTSEIYEDRIGGWFLISVSPLYDSGGKLAGSVHYGRNITALKRAEEQIRKSEADLKQAQEVAHMGSWRLDIPGNELKWSDEAYRIFGIPLNTPLTYELFLGRVSPEDREYVDSCWRAALARQPYDIEHRIVVDGAVKWVHEKAELVFGHEGEPLSGVGTVQDITDRRRSEELLRESEEKFRQIAESIQDVFWLTDPDKNRMLYVSPACEKIWGRTQQSLYETPTSWLEAIHPDDRARVLQAALTKQAAGEYDEEYRIVRPDGSLRWIRDKAFPIRDKDGRVNRIAGIAEDVSEKNILDEQLRQAQKVEALGRLAGGVAHDFNNLTAIVLGYGEMLLGRLSQEDPLRKYVEQIMAAGRRSATLTRQLLAFSRKQTLQPEVLDLNALLQNLAKMLGRLIGEDVDLRLALAANLGRVKADPGQIEQAVTNLVVNARDAMPRGGRLTVETAEVTLDETYVLSHESVVPGRYEMIALTDTGCGMDRATMARLFEPFFTTKEKGKGTGLGLSTVYGIVKQSGGYIYVYSEPGQGTTFKIYLPRTDAEQDARAVESGAPVSRGGGERILLVEDETSLLDLCQTILSQLGYRVSAAGSGPAALLLAAEKRLEFDLVVTDVIMPGMSGAELVERLRRERPELKALYMSGYPDEAIAGHGVLDSGIPFIQKPFSERTFAEKVQEVLGGKAAAARPGKSVLMIDDDEQYRDLVRHFCAKQGHLFAGAGDSAAALAALAGQCFDVLLIDLNIPGTDGERVLRELRAAGCAAPAIVLTGDVASADMDVLRPLGAVRALEKSSRAAPLLQAIEAAAASGKGATPGNRRATDDALEPA